MDNPKKENKLVRFLFQALFVIISIAIIFGIRVFFIMHRISNDKQNHNTKTEIFLDEEKEIPIDSDNYYDDLNEPEEYTLIRIGANTYNDEEFSMGVNFYDLGNDLRCCILGPENILKTEGNFVGAVFDINNLLKETSFVSLSNIKLIDEQERVYLPLNGYSIDAPEKWPMKLKDDITPRLELDNKAFFFVKPGIIERGMFIFETARDSNNFLIEFTKKPHL